MYHWFLELYNRHFILKYLRRTDKIFKSMASFIGTREAEQCRSHHQKMEKKYHSFYQILLKLRADFYNAPTPDALRADLEEHGFKVKDHTLISEAELRSGDVAGREAGAEEEGEEESLRNDLEESDKECKSHGNMLAENYENALHFTMQL